MSNHSIGQTVRRGVATTLLSLGMVFIGFLLIVGPFFLPESIIKPGARLTISGFGVLVAALGAVVTAFTRLYVRAESDLAYVRTGKGGMHAIVDGGSFVIPVLHSVTPVSLLTMKLRVERQGKDALLTHDKLRADVICEFFVSVGKNAEALFAAAKSLGARSTDPGAVMELVEDKLVNALRAVAATQTLDDLNSKREDFAQAVKKIVQTDLDPNGLVLETVTISRLDQTALEHLRDTDNVFDAVGKARVVEVTQENLVKRRTLELKAAQQIAELETNSKKAILERETEAAKAQAEATASQKKAAAEAEAGANKFSAEQDRITQEAQVASKQQVDLAGVTAEQAVQAARVKKEQALAVAEQEKDKATQEATIAKDKAVEVLTREKQIAVAEAEQRRATAEANQLEAEKTRKSAEEAVTTAKVTAIAERDKATTIIAEQASAEKIKIGERNKADIAAYAQTTQAKAEAEASTQQAEARLKLAEADKSAKSLQAEGDLAVSLVPVQVEARRVEVKNSEVEVLEKELAAKALHQTVAIELQVRLATIDAEKAANIARAEAFGKALEKADIQVWGNADTLANIQQAFGRAQAHGAYMTKLVDGTPDELKTLVVELASTIAERFANKAPTKEEILALVAEKLPLGKA